MALWGQNQWAIMKERVILPSQLSTAKYWLVEKFKVLMASTQNTFRFVATSECYSWGAWLRTKLWASWSLALIAEIQESPRSWVWRWRDHCSGHCRWRKYGRAGLEKHVLRPVDPLVEFLLINSVKPVTNPWEGTSLCELCCLSLWGIWDKSSN